MMRRWEAAREAQAWSERTYRAKVAERQKELVAGQVWTGQGGGSTFNPPIGYHILSIAGWRAHVHVHGPDDLMQMKIEDLAGCILLFGCELDDANECSGTSLDAAKGLSDAH